MKTSHNRGHNQLPLKIWLPVILTVVVIGVVAAWLWFAMPFSEKQQQIRQADTKAKQLYADHQTCVEKLNQDFEELDSNNQDAYQKAYDHCEAIRKEQNKAVDEYKKLLGNS